MQKHDIRHRHSGSREVGLAPTGVRFEADMAVEPDVGQCDSYAFAPWPANLF